MQACQCLCLCACNVLVVFELTRRIGRIAVTQQQACAVAGTALLVLAAQQSGQLLLRIERLAAFGCQLILVELQLRLGRGMGTGKLVEQPVGLADGAFRLLQRIAGFGLGRFILLQLFLQ